MCTARSPAGIEYGIRQAGDVAGGEEERGALRERAADREDQGRGDPRGGSGHQHPAQESALRQAQGRRRLAVGGRRRPQRFFADADEEWQHHAGECEATGEDRKPEAQFDGEQAVAEETEDDGRHPAEHIEAVSQRAGGAAPRGYALGEVERATRN